MVDGAIVSTHATHMSEGISKRCTAHIEKHRTFVLFENYVTHIDTIPCTTVRFMVHLFFTPTSKCVTIHGWTIALITPLEFKLMHSQVFQYMGESICIRHT